MLYCIEPYHHGDGCSLINQRWLFAGKFLDDISFLQEKNIPSAMILCGSMLYKSHDELISDVDVQLIIAADYIQYFLRELIQRYDIDDSILRLQMRYLESNLVDVVGVHFYYESLRIELKIWTYTSFCKIISLCPYVRKNIKRFEPGKSSLLTLMSLKGIAYVLDVGDYVTPLNEDPSLAIVSVPSSIDGFVDVPLIPFDQDYFLSGKLVYDTLHGKVRQVLDRRWYKLVSDILHYNDLYTEDGGVCFHAYNTEYIFRVFYRYPYFSQEYKNDLALRYYQYLNLIQNKKILQL